MKRISLVSGVFLVAIAGVLVSGCGSLVRTESAGALTTRQYSLADFNSVQVGSAFTVDISQADNFSVEIASTENVIKDITVVKDGDTLKIGLKGLHFFIGHTVLEARITMPELAGLDISGATKGTVEGFNSTGDLKAVVSGASSLDLTGQSGNFTCEISGDSAVNARMKSTSADIAESGASSVTLDMQTGSFRLISSGSSKATGYLTATGSNIRLEGSSYARLTGSGGSAEVTCSGSSNAALAGLSFGDADIDLSGASRSDVDVSGTLNVSLSGASVLTYGGNPRLGQRMSITGGSRIASR